jgi:ABC-2 type transport system ATP-binding protein
MNAIEIRHLFKQYPRILAVDDVSLDIKEGEIFALLGHNGAGKTTLIKILSCLLKQTKGEVTIFGTNIKENQIHLKAQFNISPQETAVAPNLTVFENLELIARLYGADADTAKVKANELLMRFSLMERANDRAKTLSGGMQRKLSLAMALISEPKLIYLDEPTLGLDPEARRELWNQIMILKRQTTILLTTHYLEEADYLADTIAIMKQGRLVAMGTSHELKTKYFSKKAVIVQSHGIHDELIKELTKQYENISVDGNEITIKQDNLDYNDLLLIFMKHHVIIDSITNKEATLDDVYLAINRGEVK